MWLGLIAVGLAAGFLSGYLGVGAAIVAIPVLTLVLEFEQKAAQGMWLAVMVPMALAGALMYRYQLHAAPDIRKTVVLAGAAVAGSLLGASLVGPTRPQQLKAVFGVFAITAGVVMLVKALRAWHA